MFRPGQFARAGRCTLESEPSVGRRGVALHHPLCDLAPDEQASRGRQTILGAVCVYLLWGFSYSFLYATIAIFSPTPFFLHAQPATSSTFLFFSYTTLTTVGYGNLIPASDLGQMRAMLEALLGQVSLVIIVARLVSLWGQERHTPPARPSADPNAEQMDTPPHQ